MKKKVLPLMLFFLLSSCVYDEIVISMAVKKTDPIFYFRYLRSPKKTVWLTDVKVYEAGTEKLVWMIATYDPSLFYIFEDGKLKHVPVASGETPSIKGSQMSELTFGSIPIGFTQYYPPDNRRPVLLHNVEYILGAGAASSGRILFTLDGHCRRLSSTSFSERHPLFDKDRGCLPED